MTPDQVPDTPKKSTNEPTVIQSRLSAQKRELHMKEMHLSGKKKRRMKQIVFSDEESTELQDFSNIVSD